MHKCSLGIQSDLTSQCMITYQIKKNISVNYPFHRYYRRSQPRKEQKTKNLHRTQTKDSALRPPALLSLNTMIVRSLSHHGSKSNPVLLFTIKSQQECLLDANNYLPWTGNFTFNVSWALVKICFSRANCLTGQKKPI